MAKQTKLTVALGSALSADRIAAQAAITSALSVAVPTHKTQATAPGKAVSYHVEEFTHFENAIFALCQAIEGHGYAADSMRQRVADTVHGHYGKTAPTFEQYKHLQNAMEILALDAGYARETMRKHIATAVKSAYGALPVSMAPAAVAKRLQRPVAVSKGKAAKGASDTLQAGNSTGGHVAEPHAETVESFVARVGVVNVLAAIGRIMDEAENTKDFAAKARGLIGEFQAIAA